MEPVKFAESNKTLKAPQGMTEEDVLDLHVYTDGDSCISCWKPTLRERLSILIFGRVWLSVYFGSTQPPVSVWAARRAFLTPPGRLGILWWNIRFQWGLLLVKLGLRKRGSPGQVESERSVGDAA